MDSFGSPNPKPTKTVTSPVTILLEVKTTFTPPSLGKSEVTGDAETNTEITSKQYILMNKYIILIEWTQIPATETLESILSQNFIYAKLTEHAYMIISNVGAIDIRNYISDNVKSIERIFISQVSAPAAWRGMLSDSSVIKDLFNHE